MAVWTTIKAFHGNFGWISSVVSTLKCYNVLFEVEVHTDKNHLGTVDHPLPIMPGMVADIEVITGKRTIMAYLLKPLRRGFDRALRER